MITSRKVLCGVLVAIALVIVPVIVVADDDVCSRSVIVWDHKVKKAEREGLKVEANAEALADLAQQAWSIALYRTHSERVARVSDRLDRGFSEDELLWRVDRSLFTVDEDLYGGDYRYSGDKHMTEVRYCVRRDRFEAARKRIELRRAQKISTLRSRFAELERAITAGEIRLAGNQFLSLKRDINAALAEEESYRSVISGESHSFLWWLEIWSQDVRSTRTYSLYCTATARELIQSAHLRQAESHVDEALAADHRNVQALQLGREISRLRTERDALFEKAERAAASGRASAAKRNLRRAENIDTDDRKTLQRSGMRVDALLTQYREFNPRWRIGFGLVSGSLGVDENGTLNALSKSKVEGLDAQRPLSVDLEVRTRLGRLAQTWVSAGLGRSQLTYGNYSDSLFELRSLQAGLGLKTARGRNRPLSFQVGGGVVRESVKFNGISNGGSESRTAPFVRLGIEGRRLMLFVQHAFGFEDTEPADQNLIRWSDGFQVGLMWSFP